MTEELTEIEGLERKTGLKPNVLQFKDLILTETIDNVMIREFGSSRSSHHLSVEKYSIRLAPEKSLSSFFQLLQQFHAIFEVSSNAFPVIIRVENLWKKGDLILPDKDIMLMHQHNEDLTVKGHENQFLLYIQKSPGNIWDKVKYDDIEIWLNNGNQHNLAKMLRDTIACEGHFPLDISEYKLEDAEEHENLFYLLWLLFCVEAAPGRIKSFDNWIICILNLFVDHNEEFNQIYAQCLEIGKNALTKIAENKFKYFELENLVHENCKCILNANPTEMDSYRKCENSGQLHTNCLCRKKLTPKQYAENFFSDWNVTTEIGPPELREDERFYPTQAGKKLQPVTERVSKLMEFCGDHSAVFPSGRKLDIGRQIVQDDEWMEMERELFERGRLLCKSPGSIAHRI